MKLVNTYEIRSVEDLAASTQALFLLTEKAVPIAEEEEAIALLTVLIERYEAETYPLARLSV